MMYFVLVLTFSLNTLVINAADLSGFINEVKRRVNSAWSSILRESQWETWYEPEGMDSFPEASTLQSFRHINLMEWSVQGNHFVVSMSFDNSQYNLCQQGRNDGNYFRCSGWRRGYYVVEIATPVSRGTRFVWLCRKSDGTIWRSKYFDIEQEFGAVYFVIIGMTAIAVLTIINCICCCSPCCTKNKEAIMVMIDRNNYRNIDLQEYLI